MLSKPLIFSTLQNHHSWNGYANRDIEIKVQRGSWSAHLCYVKNSTAILADFNLIGQVNDLYLLLFLLMYANGKTLMLKAKYKVILMFWNEGVAVG